jgi:outer membrane receptor protein involved in Fe transport
MLLQFRIAALLCCFSLCATLAGTPLPAAAQTSVADTTISGVLVDSAGGVPIAGANVMLFQGTTQIASTTSDANGDFTFAKEPAGLYSVVVRAEGYDAIRNSELVTTPGGTTQFRAVLQRASTTSNTIKEIGRVSASAGHANLSTSTTITQSLPSDLIQAEGYNRIGDALATLPGVNVGGLSSSVGDDLNVNIRGFGSSETSTLVDGHPIGPTGPGSGGFSYQDSPSFAIGRTVVTVGSGALGLYGTDAIGGTVDLQTIEPTQKPHFSVTQGFGNFGKSLTDLQATGTVGKLGYAFVHAVQGTYGPYAPAQRVQPGGLGLDFSSANLAANTYSTSGNYLLRNDLAKLHYAFDDKTALTFTYLDANSWDDKSGNGDNCFNSVEYQNYQGGQIIAGGPNTYPSSANPGDPGSITCTGSIAVNLNSGPACVGANTYAALSNGLVPGGPGPWQAHRLHDYHARLTHSMGNNFVTVDYFTNRFSTDYNRNLAGGLDPSGTFYTGGYSTSFVDTTGVLVSDDIATSNNDLGFGYYLQHQNEYGTKSFYDQNNNPNSMTTIENPVFGPGEYDFFLRDVLGAGKPVAYYLNAWLKHSTVTQGTYFDPRLSVVFRVTPSDVIRLTGGRSTGIPDPSLLYGSPNLNTTIQNISHVNAPPLLTSIGSVSNAGLQPETSNDLELAIGHRFKADSLIQLDFYESFEKNKIFSGLVPIQSITLGGQAQAIYAAYQSQYIAQFCKILNQNPCTVTPAAFGVSTNFNAASARFQGIELTGRQRLNPNFYADYSYDVQSGVYLGVPDSLLKSQATVINGSQINGLVLHKGSVGLDFSDHRGFEARIDTNFVGAGNGYGRPAFWYSNAYIKQDIGKFTTLNFGVQNLFNQASSIVSAVGIAPFVATNQFHPYSQDRQENFGTTGLLPAQYTASMTFHL